MFGLFGGAGAVFESVFRAYPVSFIDRPDLENGDKVILPPSALERLSSLHIEFPMLFEISNVKEQRKSHCGVLEFVAEEGVAYMPYWMMQNLLMAEGDIIKFKSTSLPKGTYVKLRPQSKDFLDISNPKAVLETTLRRYSCLTTGDSILINYNNKRFFIDIFETRPQNAVTIIETDCEVDFAPPLDYVEPVYQPAAAPVAAAGPSAAQVTQAAEREAQLEPKFTPFVGAAKRLDGKPSSSIPIPVPPVPQSSAAVAGSFGAASQGGSLGGSLGKGSLGKSPPVARSTAGKIVFGGAKPLTAGAGPSGAKPAATAAAEPPKEEPKFVPFQGQSHKLK